MVNIISKLLRSSPSHSHHRVNFPNYSTKLIDYFLQLSILHL